MKIEDIWEYIGENGMVVQGTQMDIAGHDVQIVRHNYEDGEIFVKIDNRIEKVDWEDVPEFIQRCL